MKSRSILRNAKWMSFGENNFPIVRGKFTLTNADSVNITVGCFGVFWLYINGKRVSDDVFTPVTSDYHAVSPESSPEYKHHCSSHLGEKLAHRAYCPQYDITEFVKKGENDIAFFIGRSWYYMYDTDVKLACKIDEVNHASVTAIYPEDSFTYTNSFITGYNFTKYETHDYTVCPPDIISVTENPDKYSWKKPVFIDAPDTEYHLQSCPTDKIQRHIRPVLINETGDSFIYDIGENISGWAVIYTEAQKGEKIKVRVCENLTPDKLIDDERYLGQYAEYITNGEPLKMHPCFMWHGFRYIEVTKNAVAADALLIHADVDVTADFTCDDKTISWLWSSYVRTQLDNMHMGIPSDCPHLEKCGYTGDGQLCADAVMLLFDSEEFYRKWMDDISDCQDRISGHVQYTAPYAHCGGGPGGWGCAIVHVPFVFYKTFGDIEPAKKYYPQMLKFFEYLDAHSENDLVVSDQQGNWCLGDWCTPGQRGDKRPEIPNEFVNNYFYIRSIYEAAEIAGLIGKGRDRVSLLKKATVKIKAVNNAFYDESTGNYAGNIEGANAFAVDLGLGDERTLKNLAAVYENDCHYNTGIFGTDIVTRVLFENGYGDLAAKLLGAKGYPSFGYISNYGATTLWEEWHMPRSKNHPMFGAVTRYLFTEILGIKQSDGSVGYQNITITPFLPESLNYASGFVTLGGQKISITLTRTDSGLRVKIKLDNAENVSFKCGDKSCSLKNGSNYIFI